MRYGIFTKFQSPLPQSTLNYYSGLNGSPQHHVLISGTCDCYLIGEKGLRRCNLRIWSGGHHPGLARWARYPITSVLSRVTSREICQNDEEASDHGGKVWTDAGSHVSGSANSQQRPEEVKSGFSQRAPGGVQSH